MLRARGSVRVLLLLVCLLALLFSPALAAQQRNAPQVRAPRVKNKKKQGSIADREYTKRRTSCLAADMKPCRDQDIDLENCIMRCISESCYSKIFAEPLEDGEVAFSLTNRFTRCAKEELKAAYKRGEL